MPLQIKTSKETEIFPFINLLFTAQLSYDETQGT